MKTGCIGLANETGDFFRVERRFRVFVAEVVWVGSRSNLCQLSSMSDSGEFANDFSVQGDLVYEHTGKWIGELSAEHFFK